MASDVIAPARARALLWVVAWHSAGNDSQDLSGVLWFQKVDFSLYQLFPFPSSPVFSLSLSLSLSLSRSSPHPSFRISLFFHFPDTICLWYSGAVSECVARPLHRRGEAHGAARLDDGNEGLRGSLSGPLCALPVAGEIASRALGWLTLPISMAGSATASATSHQAAGLSWAERSRGGSVTDGESLGGTDGYCLLCGLCPKPA